MRRIEKTVFLSYRRTNAPWALAIFKDLTPHGYDVFMDYSGINSGDFEQAILENIRARAHFVVLLTPSALERCSEPEDWLRCEIETAFESKRNVVPLMLDGFDFSTPAIAKQLTGSLAPLSRYQALRVPIEYFDEAMGRLRDRYLNIPLDAVLHPASVVAQEVAKQQQAAARVAPAVQEEQLTAQGYFERAFNTIDVDEKIRLYGQSIRLQPAYAYAYYNRALAKYGKGDVAGSITDYDEAVRLKHTDADIFYGRGLARYMSGDDNGAVHDYTEAIRINPKHTDAYYNRALARYRQGDMDGAIKDYNDAVQLKADDPDIYYGRGLARYRQLDLDAAIKDYDEAIRLNPNNPDVFDNRGLARQANGDAEGANRDYAEAARLRSAKTST